MSKLKEKPSAIKREHQTLQEITDPVTPLNPDPIRIRIHRTGKNCRKDFFKVTYLSPSPPIPQNKKISQHIEYHLSSFKEILIHWMLLVDLTVLRSIAQIRYYPNESNYEEVIKRTSFAK
jgi:hypothetical protein